MKEIKAGNTVRVKANGEITQAKERPTRHLPNFTSVAPQPDMLRWICENGQVYRNDDLELVDD